MLFIRKSTLTHDSFKPEEIIFINLLRSNYYLMLNNSAYSVER